MKRILLLCVAFAATIFTVSAQTAMHRGFRSTGSMPSFKTLKDATFSKERTLSMGNKLSRASLEDYAQYPKEMTVTSMTNMLYLNDFSSTLQQEGISVPSSLDFATYIPQEVTQRFAGNKVNQIIGFVPYGATGVTFWIKKNLKDEEPVWTSDRLTDFEVSMDDGATDYVCECDYVLDGQPLYVGYTLNYSRLNTSRYFVFGDVSSTAESLLIDFGDGFYDFSSNGCIPLWLETEGNAGLADYDINIDYLERTRSTPGAETPLYGYFTNYGSMPLTEVQLSYTLNGETHLFDVPITTTTGKPDTIPYLGYAMFEMTPVAPSASARHDITIEPSKLNGQPDGYAPGNTATGGIITIGDSYQRVVVMEEFTGTWCGFCPRGAFAMDKLSEEYPDEFIGIAVHGGDEMQPATYAPLLYSVGGFPSCTVNRMTSPDYTDPYYGMSDQDWGIKQLINSIGNNPCEASMGVNSTLSADNKTLQVSAHAEFSIPAKENTYSVAYVLLEDGVTGYKQVNYFATYPQYATGDLAELAGLGAEYDATFNHVARAIYDCNGIAGSLPGQAVVGETMYHHYTIEVPASVADLNNCSVVALLIDNESGEIVTAAKAKVGTATTGIADAAADAAAEISVANGAIQVSAAAGTASVYNVDGKLVASAAVEGSASISVEKGTYVVRVVNGNSVSVKKVVL